MKSDMTSSRFVSLLICCKVAPNERYKPLRLLPNQAADRPLPPSVLRINHKACMVQYYPLSTTDGTNKHVTSVSSFDNLQFLFEIAKGLSRVVI